MKLSRCVTIRGKWRTSLARSLLAPLVASGATMPRAKSNARMATRINRRARSAGLRSARGDCAIDNDGLPRAAHPRLRHRSMVARAGVSRPSSWHRHQPM